MKKIDQLRKRLSKYKRFSSHTVQEIGSEIYLDSAKRRVRELAERGEYRRIPHDEAVERNLVKKGNARLRWYENK